jgi:hypothetical protein
MYVHDFISFPAHILNHFLTKWIKTKDLCKLDSVTCNRALRVALLNIFDELVISGEVEFVDHNNYFNVHVLNLNTDFYLRWILKRNLFLVHLCINEWNEKIASYFQLRNKDSSENNDRHSYLKSLSIKG